MAEPSTYRLSLPSGGWAEFKRVITYGARRELKRLGARIGATASITRGSQEATFAVAANELAEASLADEYYPLVYLLTAWSFDLPLPTMEDMSSLDAMTWDDGEFLVETAKKQFESGGAVDFSANMEEGRDTPFTGSSESSEHSVDTVVPISRTSSGSTG